MLFSIVKVMSEKAQEEEIRRIENEKRVRNLFELIPCQENARKICRY